MILTRSWLGQGTVPRHFGAFPALVPCSNGATPRGLGGFLDVVVAAGTMVSMTATAGTRVHPPAGATKKQGALGPVDFGDAPPRSRPTVLVGIAVALWVALLGLALLVCVVLVGWVTAAHHSNALAPALAMAVAIWLLAQHCALAVPGGDVSVVPLGLSWLLGILLVRGGRQAARLTDARDLLDTAGVTVAIAVPYAVAAALLTKAVPDAGVRASALQGLVGAFVLSFVCAGFGALRETGGFSSLAARLPNWSRVLLRSAVSGFAVVIGVAAIGGALALIGHIHRAQVLSSSLHPGIPGTALLIVASIAYLPNAVAWVASLGAGPGFAVGTGTSVSLFGVHVGAVPALPLLAPLPNSGSVPAIAWLSILGPLAAGVVTGWLVARATSSDDVTPKDVALNSGTPNGAALKNDAGPTDVTPDNGAWWRRYRLLDAGLALAAGMVCAVLLGIVCWLSSGAFGPGRMAVVGPTGYWVGLAAAAEIGVVAAGTVVVVAWWSNRSKREQLATP